uniref:Uncharacterized protein n=1 Tax=Heterorhabditis bacteriophora TaxID=37862 RepID=A0A1I7W9M1_HETBA
MGNKFLVQENRLMLCHKFCTDFDYTIIPLKYLGSLLTVKMVQIDFLFFKVFKRYTKTTFTLNDKEKREENIILPIFIVLFI